MRNAKPLINLLFLCLLAGASFISNSQTITRNSSPQPNPFMGFGFYPGFTEWYDMTDKQSVINALFVEMKPHVIRKEFEPQFSDQNGGIDKNHEDLVRFIKEVKIARDHGITKWIGVHWSPPEEFRKCWSSKCKCEDGSFNSLKTDKYDDYAEHIRKLVDHLVSQGVPAPYAISLQNEASYCPSWDGLVLDGPELKKLAIELRKALDNGGYGMNGSTPIRIQAPEGGSISGSLPRLGGENFPYFDEESFKNAVQDVATHSYAGQWSAGIYADRWKNSIAHHNFGTATSSTEVWQTEWTALGTNGALNAAIEMTREIGKHLAYLGSNYWIYWLGWHPHSEDYPEEILTFGDKPDRTYNYYVFKAIVNNTMPDGRIYKFSSTDNSLYVSGDDNDNRYVDLYAIEGNGKSIVVMANNTSSDKDITVKGLKNFGTSCQAYRFDAASGVEGKLLYSRSIDANGDVEGTIDLDDKSVVILVCNGGTATSRFITITSPYNGEQIVEGNDIPITANTSGNNIQKVEFYQGNVKLGEAVDSPYTFIWNNVPEGTYELKVVMTDDEGNLESGTITIHVIKPYGVSNCHVTIDGHLDEAAWQISETVEKNVIGTSDNNVQFGMLWDNDYLYVGVEVTDNNLQNDSSPGIADDDGVEIYLDPENNGGSYGSYDRQYIKKYNSDDIWEKNDVTTGVQHAWKTASSGYSIEVAIPWSNININPSAGLTFGFDIGNNDDDDGGARESQLIWKGNDNNWKNTSGFGVITLLSLQNCDGSPVGVAKAVKEEKPFKIFPNPTEGNILIALAKKSRQLLITDVSGKVVYRQNIEDKKEVNIDLKKILQSGVYIVNIDYHFEKVVVK